jgi:hypothetical protein
MRAEVGDDAAVGEPRDRPRVDGLEREVRERGGEVREGIAQGLRLTSPFPLRAVAMPERSDLALLRALAKPFTRRRTL